MMGDSHVGKVTEEVLCREGVGIIPADDSFVVVVIPRVAKVRDQIICASSKGEHKPRSLAKTCGRNNDNMALLSSRLHPVKLLSIREKEAFRTRFTESSLDVLLPGHLIEFLFLIPLAVIRQDAPIGTNEPAFY